MMKTRNLKLDQTKYWLITADDAFFIQNNSTSILQVIASDSQPAPTANGHNLCEGEVVTQANFTGTIWATGNCTLVITDTTGTLVQP